MNILTFIDKFLTRLGQVVFMENDFSERKTTDSDSDQKKIVREPILI